MASSLAPPAPPYAALVVPLPPTPAPPASASHAIARSALIILGVICLVAAASIAINRLLRRRASRRRASAVALPLAASGGAPLPLPRSGPAPARRAPALLADADCIVCLCAIVPRAEAQLPCRHRFHATCIDEWVRSSPASPTCPLCRAAVQPPRPADAVDQRRTARRSSAAGDRRRVAASGEAPLGPSRVSGV